MDQTPDLMALAFLLHGTLCNTSYPSTGGPGPGDGGAGPGGGEGGGGDWAGGTVTPKAMAAPPVTGSGLPNDWGPGGDTNLSRGTAQRIIEDYVSDMFTLYQPSTIVLLCLYVPIFMMSLVGNSLVIFVVYKNPTMRRVKNLFLVNLAVADLLITLICIPMMVAQLVFRLWVYGEVMCRVTGFIQGVTVACSIFTLTVLSVDRFMAIRAPLSMRRLTGHCQAYKALVGIWLVSALVVGPILYIRRVYTVTFGCFDLSVAYCIEQWPNDVNRRIYSIFLLVVTCLVPFLIVSVCYTMIGRTLCSNEFQRKSSESGATILLGRKRVARMLVVLIAAFILCWLPYNVCSLILDINLHYVDTKILPYTMWLAHAHSFVNPILYWFLNKGFRHSMRRALWCRLGSQQRRESRSPQSPGDLVEFFRMRLDQPFNNRPRGARDRRAHRDVALSQDAVPGDLSDIRREEERRRVGVGQQAASDRHSQASRGAASGSPSPETLTLVPVTITPRGSTDWRTLDAPLIVHPDPAAGGGNHGDILIVTPEIHGDVGRIALSPPWEPDSLHGHELSLTCSSSSPRASSGLSGETATLAAGAGVYGAHSVSV